jgi:hypothetical protein
MMMPPRTLVHQRIARNSALLLNERLQLVETKWQAERAIGVLIPGDENYNPTADVTVIDAEIRLGQLFAERFYLVAEVLSEGDKPEVIAGRTASESPFLAILGTHLCHPRACPEDPALSERRTAAIGGSVATSHSRRSLRNGGWSGQARP